MEGSRHIPVPMEVLSVPTLSAMKQPAPQLWRSLFSLQEWSMQRNDAMSWQLTFPMPLFKVTLMTRIKSKATESLWRFEDPLLICCVKSHLRFRSHLWYSKVATRRSRFCNSGCSRQSTICCNHLYFIIRSSKRTLSPLVQGKSVWSMCCHPNGEWQPAHSHVACQWFEILSHRQQSQWQILAMAWGSICFQQNWRSQSCLRTPPWFWIFQFQELFKSTWPHMSSQWSKISLKS